MNQTRHYGIASAPFALAQHAFVCRCDRQVVILDLRRDRYLAVDAYKHAALAALVQDWPACNDETVDADATPALALAHSLMSLGVLTQPPQTGKSAAPLPAVVARSEWNQSSQASTGTMFAVVLATIGASLLLRWLPFERVVERVRRRQLQQRATSDIYQLRQLVGQFRCARAWLFSSDNRCLHETLALLEFLALHHHYPRWIFGVHTTPFAAHCWLQHDDIVVNDSLDKVAQFTPIMMA